MIKTDICISEAERKQLQQISSQIGKPEKELIREAITQFIAKKLTKQQSKLAAIQAANGLWASRKDLPDFLAIRKELNR